MKIFSKKHPQQMSVAGDVPKVCDFLNGLMDDGHLFSFLNPVLAEQVQVSLAKFRRCIRLLVTLTEADLTQH